MEVPDQDPTKSGTDGDEFSSVIKIGADWVAKLFVFLVV
jgi:hypothetical protein